MSASRAGVIGLGVALLAASPRAEAFKCKKWAGCTECAYMSGSSQFYFLNVSDFTAAQTIEITEAANAWKAGSGEILRGADWAWARVDVQVDGDNTDGNNNVRMKSDAWFQTYFGSQPLAITVRQKSGCDTVEVNLSFREGVNWTVDLPSNAASSERSIGQVAVHEFGHMLGLQHFGAVEASMNSKYPAGGDIAEVGYRIHEDDYTGLVDAKADASTGKTLMLSRFRQTATGESWEVWTDENLSEEGLDWDGCPGTTIYANDGPTEILALINGTSAVSPVIEWTLDSGATCFAGTEYSLGTATPTIAANTPFAVSPDGGYAIPNNTPAGFYRLCAKIDVDDLISESSEVDNVVRSDKDFEVLSCP